VQFEVADIDSWADQGPFDVIFANAVLQWVPDHATLLPALAGKLSDGGSLAIQMPDNLNEPSHRLDARSRREWPMGHQTGWRRRATHRDGECQRLLLDAASALFAGRCVAHHLSPSTRRRAGVVEWFKGSGLIPFLEPAD
jgi:trans-aconitate 2-methyltransferase